MTKPLPDWTRDALMAVVYAAAYHAAFQTAYLFWFLPAGVRFTALLLAPYRRWPLFLVAGEIGFMLYAPGYWQREFGDGLWMSNAAVFAAAALGPWWLRRLQLPTHPMRFRAMAWLLGAMAVSAVAAILLHDFSVLREAERLSTLRVALQLGFGDYIGMLALVPAAWMALRDRPDAALLRRWRRDVPFMLLPALALYAVLIAVSRESELFVYYALLCCVPSVYFAMRGGWRGAALALGATTVVLAIGGKLGGNPGITVEAQAFLAVIGSATLLLGTANDALRDHRRRLQASNADLLAASAKLEILAADLRDAARRNLDTAEQTRRWITAELHDEIGQNLTALQTRIRLLERRTAPLGSELTAEIGDILAHMRKAVSGLMSNLRPAGLDEFGLAQALREGAIRNLIESNGLTWSARIEDAHDLLNCLDNDAQTALYRIVQEAATNTIRHSDASRLRVRLRAREAGENVRVLLVIDDDGRGFDTNQRASGIGLQGIRDRVLALGGRLRVRSGASGTHLVVQARLPNSAA